MMLAFLNSEFTAQFPFKGLYQTQVTFQGFERAPGRELDLSVLFTCSFHGVRWVYVQAAIFLILLERQAERKKDIGRGGKREGQ